ncbi:MAG TPA: phosphohistidine phosphatase SixA [Bryobacterales bacterium]|nr:phosphohistidine phosphatase SixA [Bryobacterales bacterium]
MEIYILRHGIAEPGRPGEADSSRRLTAEGKEKLLRILTCARKAGVEPDVLLASPYRRAIETAELARESLKVSAPIIQAEALTPMEPAEQVWEQIRLHKDAKQILLAGHEPQLSSLVCWLIGAPATRIEMKKGALARIDVESPGPRPAGVLVWLLTARLAGG